MCLPKVSVGVDGWERIAPGKRPEERLVLLHESAGVGVGDCILLPPSDFFVSDFVAGGHGGRDPKGQAEDSLVTLDEHDDL